MHQQVGAPKKLSLKGGSCPCLPAPARARRAVPPSRPCKLPGYSPGRRQKPLRAWGQTRTPNGAARSGSASDLSGRVREGRARARWTPIRAALALAQFTASGARALLAHTCRQKTEHVQAVKRAPFFLVFQRSSRGGLRSK